MVANISETESEGVHRATYTYLDFEIWYFSRHSMHISNICLSSVILLPFLVLPFPLLRGVTLKVTAVVLGWDDSLSISQITLQRKSNFTFQVEKQWQMADLGAGLGLHKV